MAGELLTGRMCSATTTISSPRSSYGEFPEISIIVFEALFKRFMFNSDFDRNQIFAVGANEERITLAVAF